MDNILSREERLIHSFRALCSRYGYRPYRMSKFEEYDLYANNRSFLPEGGVITFTDTNGRLMALKPDVTLSIARNLTPAPGESVRVFYDESVYRAPDRQLGFQEITQTGLEYLGEADAYAMGEVVSLAAQSLELIEPGYILDVSHMGFMAGLIDALGVDSRIRAELMRAVSGRNAPRHPRHMRRGRRLRRAGGAALPRLRALRRPRRAVPTLGEMSVNSETERAVRELTDLRSVFEGFGILDRVNLDLAVTGDMEYYNGLVFKGYVPGVPAAVLSGGRYDSLMAKLGKSCGAIGFALYLNLLDRLYESEGAEYDADVLLLSEDARPEALAAAARSLADSGKSVLVARSEGGRRCRRRARLNAEGGLEYLD